MILIPKLTVNGVEQAITGFSYSAPRGGLGSSLTVALSLPDTTPVPPGANVKFEIGAGAGDPVAYSWVTILKDGKLAGRDYTIGWSPGTPGSPGDLLSFNALNPLADRWGLAPRRPVIMFDPAKVEGGGLNGTDANSVRDSNGAAIRPVIEPIDGLNLRQVLDRAYTNKSPAISPAAQSLGESLGISIYGDSLGVGTGCGFDRVVTNIPNFPVDRVDFTLTSGWHGGVSGLLSNFEPIYFEEANTLYIIDPSRGLPVGFTPTAITLCYVENVRYTIAPTELVNAIILSYEIPASGSGGTVHTGLIPSDRFTSPEETQGENGTRVVSVRKVRDWKNLQTGLVEYSQDLETETSVYGTRNGAETLISREVMQIEYQGKVKSSHLRTIEAVYPDPTQENAPDKFGEVFTESSRLYWRPDIASPGESELIKSITETEGVVLVEDGNIEGKKQRTPILDAARGGLIQGDASQYTERKPIQTTIERLVEAGVNQSQIETVIVDELTGAVKTPPPVQTRTGSRSTSLGGGGRGSGSSANRVQELITEETSIALYGLRRAGTLDVGELGPTEGRKIARTRLRRLANPRKAAELTLPGIDFTLRRGSIVNPPLRIGLEGNYIVEGYTITGRGLGTPEGRVNQTVEVSELG